LGLFRRIQTFNGAAGDGAGGGVFREDVVAFGGGGAAGDGAIGDDDLAGAAATQVAQYLDVVDYNCTYRVMAYFRSGCKNEKARAFYEFLKKHAEV
jgi:hypothetical protein